MNKKLEREYAIKNTVLTGALKEFTGWSDRDFVRYILQLRLEAEKLERKIENLQKQAAGDKKIDLPVYKQNWTVSNKLHFFLLSAQRPLPSEELLKIIHSYDRSFKNYEWPEKVLSTYLNRSLKAGRLIRVKLPGIRFFYYGLPEWLNENGKLKEDYAKYVKYFE